MTSFISGESRELSSALALDDSSAKEEVSLLLISVEDWLITVDFATVPLEVSASTKASLSVRRAWKQET